MDVDDKIWASRLAAGVAYGVVVFILLYFMDPIRATAVAWSFSPMVYYATIVYVYLKYRPARKWHLYVTGLLEFYASWLATVFVLYDLLKPG